MILVQLRLPAGPPPQADDSRLGAEGHVDQLLVEPTLGDAAVDRPQNEAVFSDLEEEKIAADVRAAVDGEALTVHLARRQWFQIDVVGGLKEENVK